MLEYKQVAEVRKLVSLALNVTSISDNNNIDNAWRIGYTYAMLCRIQDIVGKYDHIKKE